MIVNAANKNILDCKPGDEITVCNAEEYYNEQFPRNTEVVDIVREPNKLIILTR